MEKPFYVLERVDDPKFPYRLTIRRGEEILLAIRVQDRWPGQKGNIFCMREEGRTFKPPLEEIERVPIISMNNYGKKLILVLDRAINKRCDFIFLKKPYKTKEGEYEVIFWRTQKLIREVAPKVRIANYNSQQMEILVDYRERYPWKFPMCIMKRAPLPCGDYALMNNGNILAIIERKTYENMLTDLCKFHILNQNISELLAYKHSAIVIEAEYKDFLNPEKNNFISPNYCSRLFANIFAIHPKFQIVFAGNRKIANLWVHRYFEAVQALENDQPLTPVKELIEKYNENAAQFITPEYFNVIKSLRDNPPEGENLEQIRSRFNNIPDNMLKKALKELEKEGVITKYKSGRIYYYKKT